MKPRESVKMVLNREKPDPCPMQISFTLEFASLLLEDRKIREEVHNHHGGGNTYELERALGGSVAFLSWLGEL